MAPVDDRIKIAGLYDFGLGEQRYIPFAEARQQKMALQDKLSSFDELDYGYIWFMRGPELIEEIQPLSLCSFVRWGIANASEFAKEGVIWLTLCENDALIYCRPSEVTVQVWDGGIPTHQWQPYFGRELSHAYSFRIESDNTDFGSFPFGRAHIRCEFTVSLSDWLIGMRDLARDQRALFGEIEDWVYANPRNFLTESDREQVNKAFGFFKNFPDLEGNVNSLLQVVAPRRPAENGEP